MNKYKLLDLMIEDNKSQETLYKPTSFWEVCSQQIADDLKINL